MPMVTTELLASLAQHRVLSAQQVRSIHFPGRSLRWARMALAHLADAGLAAFVVGGGVAGAPRRLWYATERGARAALEADLLEGMPRLLDADAAAGPLQRHTLAVNDAAICFLRAACQRGDEFGALSWRHEVVHPLSRGRRRHSLFADAVLSYLRVEPTEAVMEQRFLELDRATLSVDRLAAELGRYAHLYRACDKAGAPLWRSSYPAFPPVLCVLDGAPRAALERRRDVTLALLAADPELSRASEVAISICLLDDLRLRGPFEPIFLSVGEHGRSLDWLGRTSLGQRKGR
jgi:hypothetical protein